MHKKILHKDVHTYSGAAHNTTTAVSIERPYRLTGILFTMLLVAVPATILFGRHGMSAHQLWQVLSGIAGLSPVADDIQQASIVLFVVRLPRALLAVAVGAALAASGAAYQSVFKNPMVSPDILGVSNAAAVGASIVLLMDGSAIAMQLTAFFCGLGAVALVYSMAVFISGRQDNLLVLLLAGLVVSSLFMSALSCLKFMADSEQKLPGIVFWMMGSFARSGTENNMLIMLVALLAGGLPLWLLRWRLNALAFGDEEALALGVNVRAVRRIVIVCATLLTAASVSLCGSISWIGLIVPHIARFLAGPDYRRMFPVTLLTGGLFMLITDTVCRSLPGELPVGILTSFLGAPLFLWLLFHTRKSLA